MKSFFTFAAAIALSLATYTAQAQDKPIEYQAVILNYEKSCFGDNKPLPVGKYFVINGAVRSDISYVEASLYSGGRLDRGLPLYQGSWRRNTGGPQASLFNIPMNHQLIGNAEYDLVIQYFRETTPTERNTLKAETVRAMDWYMDQSLEAIFARNNTDDRTNQMIGDMNSIARKGLAFYRNRQGLNFKGFSDLTRGKLRQLMASHPAATQRSGIDNATSAKRRNLLTSELKTLVHGEVETYLNVDLFVLADRLPIQNYPTERMKNAIGLNIGAAAVIIDGSSNPANTGISPYIGVSFPIANQSKSEILRTASVSAGLFLTGLKDVNGLVYSGPVLRTPSFVSVGIKPFRFIRVQAGTAFLQQNISTSEGIRQVVTVKPMIGLSLEFDFSVTNQNSLSK